MDMTEMVTMTMTKRCKDYPLFEEVIEIDETLHVITIDSDIGDYIY